MRPRVIHLSSLRWLICPSACPPLPWRRSHAQTAAPFKSRLAAKLATTRTLQPWTLGSHASKAAMASESVRAPRRLCKITQERRPRLTTLAASSSQRPIVGRVVSSKCHRSATCMASGASSVVPRASSVKRSRATSRICG